VLQLRTADSGLRRLLSAVVLLWWLHSGVGWRCVLLCLQHGSVRSKLIRWLVISEMPVRWLIVIAVGSLPAAIVRTACVCCCNWSNLLEAANDSGMVSRCL
jgi:hypothetical protein